MATLVSVDAGAQVIPPGQEELVGAMLGLGDEVLPGGCRLVRASIQQSRVTGSYDCAGTSEGVVVELRHPDEGDGARRTERFALHTTAGTAPPELLNALVDRIRPLEGAWRWTKIDGGSPSEPSIAPTLDRIAVPARSHWLVPLAMVLLIAACVRARPGIARRDFAVALALFAGALALRLTLGPWGPFRVNALGPMWLDGAISDPGQLYGYGPGYPEIFSLVARLALEAPDTAIFAANCAFSALIPALAFVLARLFGLSGANALAPGVLLAVEPVALRVGATESYTPSITALTLLATAALVGSVLRTQRGDWMRAALLALAAGLLLSQSVRIHPVAWLPAALAPLAVAAAGREITLQRRLLQTGVAVLMVGSMIAFTSGGHVVRLLGLIRHEEVMAPSKPIFVWWGPVAAGALGCAAFRWARAPWIIVPALIGGSVMVATRGDFGQSWVWQQSYDRLFITVPVIATAAFIPEAWLCRRSVQGASAALAVIIFVVSIPFVRTRTTDQQEYRWARDSLNALPHECLVTYVGQVGDRSMMLPIFGPPALHARGVVRLDEHGANDLAKKLQGSQCTYYVRTSLCSSVEGRPVCDDVEAHLHIESVASARFSPVPSNRYSRYDRPEVVSTLGRVVSIR